MDKKNTVDDVVQGAILKGYEELQKLTPGSKEYSEMNRAIISFCEVYYDYQKATLDRQSNDDNRKREMELNAELKREQMEHEAKWKELEIEMKKLGYEVDERIRDKQIETDIEMKKLQMDNEFTIKQQDIESRYNIHADDLDDQKKSRWVDWALRGAEIALGIASGILATGALNKCLSFEETGCFTSNASRGIVSRMSNFFGFGFKKK